MTNARLSKWWTVQERKWVGKGNSVDVGDSRNINERCRLERAPWKPQRSSKKFTPEQRLTLALKFLDEHAFLTVRNYQRLTGLLQTAATKELKQWADLPESGIDIAGRGSHRVYVKKKVATE